jgi:hypothetical protein
MLHSAHGLLVWDHQSCSHLCRRLVLYGRYGSLANVQFQTVMVVEGARNDEIPPFFSYGNGSGMLNSETTLVEPCRVSLPCRLIWENLDILI